MHITFLPANSELSDQNKKHVHNLPLLIHQRLIARWYGVGLVTERLVDQSSKGEVFFTDTVKQSKYSLSVISKFVTSRYEKICMRTILMQNLL